MKINIQSVTFSLSFLFFSSISTLAQMENLHGDQKYSYSGIHSGNLIRTTFYNDGKIGSRHEPPDIGCEWPINSGHYYLYNLSMFVGSEVLDSNELIKHIVTEANGTQTGNPSNPYSGDAGPNNEWWTWTPLPGFANDQQKRIAMSHQKSSWPVIWPDKMNDSNDPGWENSWNGYFGKDIFNADQESYYVMDDFNNKEFLFYPDSMNLSRRGLGLRANVRGFQWGTEPVKDVLFFHYEFQNIGTYNHHKMNFGLVTSPMMGNTATAGDGSDDSGGFSTEFDVGYFYDYDDIGGGGWSPVGYLGLAFFESAGNSFDGIDNDGDASNITGGKIIDSEFFEPKVIKQNDDIVVIDYKTYERQLIKMPSEGISISYSGRTYKIYPGDTIEEIPGDMIDNNLNGLIDENNGTVFGQGENEIFIYLNVGLKAVDYFTGNGLSNMLIDERRDDLIDNDGDWSLLSDDVGLDGLARTYDEGEGDGLPTSGAGTEFPGEPHIDKTDVDEADMIGLSAYNIVPSFYFSAYSLSDDEALWQGISPGFFSTLLGNDAITVLLGSGYFPMLSKQNQNFSIGYVFGLDFDDLVSHTKSAEKIFLNNYQIEKPSSVPTLVAVPGDNRVTIYWDDSAEYFIDPITGMDFEGYKVYRSQKPDWSDLPPITDAYGTVIYREPVAQFDLVNEYSGYSEVAIRGVHFWLGTNSGLRHSWVDSLAQNDTTYYYAVTSYDHGYSAAGIAPSECTKYIVLGASGQVIDKGSNVVVVTPKAHSEGYKPAQMDISHVQGTSSGRVKCSIIDPRLILDNHTYHLSFEDTTFQDNTRFTKSFSLKDITTGRVLIDRLTLLHQKNELPMIDGFRLLLYNDQTTGLDSVHSTWNRSGIYNFELVPYNFGFSTKVQSADFNINFGQIGMDTSTVFNRGAQELPAIPVNFEVINKSLNKKMNYALWEKDVRPGEQGLFTAFSNSTASDVIIFLDDFGNPGWEFSLKSDNENGENPIAGDGAELILYKPFLSDDLFELKSTGEITSVKGSAKSAGTFLLYPNYPNPFNSQTSFKYYLPNDSYVTLTIYNILGQRVRVLGDQFQLAGEHLLMWDGCNNNGEKISSGTYIFQIKAGNFVKTSKMLLLQ